GPAAPESAPHKPGSVQSPAKYCEVSLFSGIPCWPRCAASNPETKQDRESPQALRSRTAENRWGQNESSDASRATYRERMLRRALIQPGTRSCTQPPARAAGGSPYASVQTFPRSRSQATPLGAPEKCTSGRIRVQP